MSCDSCLDGSLLVSSVCTLIDDENCISGKSIGLCEECTTGYALVSGTLEQTCYEMPYVPSSITVNL